MITASAGNKIRKADQYTVDYNDLSVFPKEMKNRWVRTGDEKITNIPSIPSKFTLNEVGEATLRRVYNAYNHSTARVVDGSFIRMKSMSLFLYFCQRRIRCLARKQSYLALTSYQSVLDICT